MATKKKGPGRPKHEEPSATLELTIPPRLAEYLDDLLELQGFGNSRQEIIRQFVWNEINRLIPSRLKQRRGTKKRRGGS